MLYRKKHFLLAFLFACLFILPINTSAEEHLGNYYKVNTSKVWKIHFSTSVDEKSAKRAISIKSGNVTYYPVIDIDGETIIVYPPKNGYAPEQSYILQISENLKSSNGKKLTTGYSLNFYTDSKETPKDETPQLEEEEPSDIDEETSQLDEETPELEEDTSQLEEETPQLEEEPNYPSTEVPFTEGFTARSQELRSLWQKLKPVYDGPLAEVNASTTAPYSPGTLRREALNDALNLTNYIREVASLPAVSLNEAFNERAQAASLVNGVNQSLSHYPSQPSGMEENLYHLGYLGASKSNIGYGYRSIVQSIQYGYMEDGDSNNISHVGHRLWILSPKLEEVGFGYVSPANGRPMTAMYVIDDEMYYNPSVDYDFISWPAETAMPTSFFTSEFPWSISFNPDKYDASKTNDIKVTLTRINDNKTWNFDSNQKDGFFTISLSNYGYLPFTIIFRPDDKPEYNQNDVYHVKVEGIYDRAGNAKSVEFQTQFFDL